MIYDLYVCRLEELVGDVLVKREASSAALSRFGEFTGSALVQYNILNLADI
jgi:hypothetical protein